MLGVKLVAKLYDVPPADGVVTAFDAHNLDVYVGTEKGLLQKFTVAVEQEGDEGDTKIYTLHVKTQQISREKRVARIQHSHSKQNLLFVLCGKVLQIYDSETLVAFQDVATGVGTFSVSALKSEKHLICACEKYGKAIHVYSFDGNKKDVAPKHIQELLLPESVQTLVEHNGILCVGLNREYSMLSVSDGDAKSLLALNGHDPCMALGDGEVYLRLHSALFVVSVKSMPGSKGSVLKRTIRFESEPQCIGLQHPYLFSFGESACDVYCNYEDEVIERLPVQGISMVAKGAEGTLFFAGKTRMWMMQMHPLRAQLDDLVTRYKIEDAFHLLHSQSPSDDLAEIEVELNIMSGFAHLYHNAPMFAIRHFNEHLDVREILCHVPSLVPKRRDDEKDPVFWEKWEHRHRFNRHAHDIEQEWMRVFEELPMVDSKTDCRLHEGENVDLRSYLADAWDSLKRSLVVWLRSLAATAPKDQRRCIEYALLILYLEFGDHRSLYRLIMEGKALCVADCCAVLEEQKEYRLLMALHVLHGCTEDAEEIFNAHLNIPSRIHSPDEPAAIDIASLVCLDEAQEAHEGVRVPSSNLHEIFFAVESLDLEYITTVIREDPKSVVVKDEVGCTALHHAAALPYDVISFQRKMSILSYLVDASCSIVVQNDAKQTPMDIVLGLEHPKKDLIAGSMLSAHLIRVQCNQYASDTGIAPRFGVQGAPSQAAGSWSGFSAS